MRGLIQQGSLHVGEGGALEGKSRGAHLDHATVARLRGGDRGGWIAKFWFRTWRDARTAKTEIEREGWTPGSLGRKVRVGVGDGHDGQKLVEFVLGRWPDVRRIQLRCD
jgi:hypothetical protein